MQLEEHLHLSALFLSLLALLFYHSHPFLWTRPSMCQCRLLFCATLHHQQRFLTLYLHNTQGLRCSYSVPWRFDADAMWQSATLTHSLADGVRSGPSGRSWSLVGSHCHNWSSVTEAGGPVEETLARIMFRSNIFNHHKSAKHLAMPEDLVSWAGLNETEHSCLGGSFSRDKKF